MTDNPIGTIVLDMRNNNPLATVAFAFGIISLVGVIFVALIYVFLGIGMYSAGTQEASILGTSYITGGVISLVTLAWGIPMTLKMNKIRKGEDFGGIAFCICTLLFWNVISGILLLVDQSKNY